MTRIAFPFFFLKILLHWTVATVFSTGVLAQTDISSEYQVDIQQIDGRYGLESMIVRTIWQDKKGFIWISAATGLARFNGYEMQYFKDPKFRGTINTGINLIGDIEGKIIVTQRRVLNAGITHRNKLKEYYVVYLLEPESGKILPFSSSIGKNAPFDIHNIRYLVVYGETLFIGSNDGRVYTYYNGKWNLFYEDPSCEPISTILMDTPGKPYWIVTGDTLKYLGPNGNCLDRGYVDLNIISWYIGLDKNGHVWINSISAGDGNFFSYKSPGQPLQKKHPVFGKLSDYQAVNFDREGRIWLWKDNVFHIFDPEGRKISEIPAQGSILDFPKVYFDAQNRAWISLRQQFVAVRISKKRFEPILAEKSISTRQMVEVRPGIVWAATYNGLYEFSTNSPDYKKIPLPTSYLFGLCQDGPNVWVGIHGHYVLKVDSRSGTRERWEATGITPAESAALHLINPFRDKKGKIWIGSNRGIFGVDTLRREVYRDHRFNAHQLDQAEVNFQWENGEGIWTCTNMGLYLLDPEKGVKTYFPEFSKYSISYIYEKPKGVFWLATRGKGLLKWERGKGRITEFGIAEGIFNPVIHAIFEDEKGRFWMPSDRGLLYFEPKTRLVHIFYESDGLTHDEFNRRSYLKLSDGSFLFGGIRGINRFHPKDFDELDRSSALLHITHYDVWDPEQRKFVSKTVQLLKDRRIDLDASQISFQIKFALLDYDKLAENRYAYKLEGIDKDWIYIRENSLRFTSLPYGKFTLRIKGAAPRGGWSANEIALPIEVKRPVYLNGWFFVLSSILLVLLIWSGIRWRLYRLDKAKKLLEQEVEARTGELVRERHTIAQQNMELAALNQTKDHLMAVIGHELRGPMISIQNIGDNISYLLKNGKEAQAATLGEHIKHRVFSLRMLLDNLLYWGLTQAGKQEVFREKVPLRPLLIESVEFIEFWVTDKKLKLSISCPPELTLYTDRNILRMVLLNLLTNAIKFTHEGGDITLKASQNAGLNYIIEVADTGIGMDTAYFSKIKSSVFRSTPGTKGEKGTGMGLALCQKLLESLNGQLFLKPDTAKGCTFNILLPSNYPLSHPMTA